MPASTMPFPGSGSPARPIESEFFALHMLRLLCAVGIMTGHWGDHYYERLLPQGQLPIDLFFMLEGFLTAHALRGLGSDRPAGKLIGRKLFELYPLYAMGLLAGLVVTAFLGNGSGDWSPGRLTLAALLGSVGLPTFSATPYAAVFPFNPPTWAIVLEFWALAAVCLWRLDRRFARLAVLFAVAALAQAALSIVWRNFNMGWEGGSYLGGLTRAAYGFLGGLVLYRIVAVFGARLPRIPAVLTWLAFAGLLFVQIRFVALPLLFVVTPALVVLAAVSSVPAWLRGACAAARRNAYAFYLLHYPVLVLYKASGPQLGASERFMTSLGSYLTALLLAAAAALIAERLAAGPAARLLARRRLAA